MPQPVIHWEIISPDAKKAQEFYQNLFGWEVNADNPFEYGMVSAADGGIGGGIGPGDESKLTFYVQVDDQQAALDRAEELGGTTVAPVTEIPDMVTFAMFADPDGNVVGLVKG
jgi:uncharacterized protein